MKKQASGKYRTKVKIGTDENGKDINKWITANTKKEVEDKKREIIARYITGEGTNDDVLFGTYVKQWYEAYKKPNIKPSTQLTYTNVIDHYLIPQFGNRNMRSITTTEIQLYINTLTYRSSLIITLAVSIMNNVFKTAYKERIVSRNTAADIIRPKSTVKKEKHYLTPAERKLMEETAATHKYGLFIAMLYYTGMRLGECCALKWEDIDLKAGTIHIQRAAHRESAEEDLKTTSSRRTVPIPPPLAAIIRSRPIGLPSSYVFVSRRGNPYNPGDGSNVWKRIMHDIGLVEYYSKYCYTPLFSPHALRHNYITMCYENGIDAFTASKLAGHTDIKTTMNIYTHLSQEHLQTVADKVSAMFATK